MVNINVQAALAAAEAAAASATAAAVAAEEAAEAAAIALPGSAAKMAAVDADPASDFRVQQDGRLAAELDPINAELEGRLSEADMSATFAPKWQPTTAYTAGQIVMAPDGGIVKAKASFTSGASYNAANWTVADGLLAAFGAGGLDVSVDDYGAVGDGRKVLDASMTSGSATLTSATAAFVAGDVGKKILVAGVGASGATLSTTITARASSTSVTLATTALTTKTNVAALWGTDDTTAMQAAIDAVVAAGSGRVRWRDKIYIAAGAIAANDNCYSQLMFHNPGGEAQTLRTGTIRLEGPHGKNAVIVSTLVGQTYSATYGIPSVIGGPTWEQTSRGYMRNLAVRAKNLNIVVPGDPTVAAWNMEQIAHASWEECDVWPLANQGISTFANSTIMQPTHTWAVGFIPPGYSNWEQHWLKNCHVTGMYIGAMGAEHHEIEGLTVYRCKVALGVPLHQHYQSVKGLSASWCPYTVATANPRVGLYTNQGDYGTLKDGVAAQLDIEMLDIEDAIPSANGNTGDWAYPIAHIYDPAHALRGTIRGMRVTGGTSTTVLDDNPFIVNGGANIKVLQTNAPTKPSKPVQRTAGDITLTAAGIWTSVASKISGGTTADLDLGMSALPGDVIEVSADLCGGNEAIDLFLDFATIIGTGEVHRFSGSSASGQGLQGLWCKPSIYDNGSTTVQLKLARTDVSYGWVTVRLMYRATGTKTLFANTAIPLNLSAKNLGPAW